MKSKNKKPEVSLRRCRTVLAHLRRQRHRIRLPGRVGCRTKNRRKWSRSESRDRSTAVPMATPDARRHRL